MQISKKIEVGFLASSFVDRSSSGTAKHIKMVTQSLCTSYRSTLNLTFFCNSEQQYKYLENHPIYSSSNLILFPSVRGRWLKSFRQYFKYSLSTRKNKIDVLHFSVPRFYPFFWLFPAKKFICTFHAGGDITASRDSFILSRELYNITAKLFYRKLDSIIAVSAFGKKEISEAYGIPAQLISVIHQGTDDLWNLEPKNLNIYGKKIIVVIGRWQKYKNVQLVAEAISKANSNDLDGLFFIFLGKKISSNSDLINSLLIKVDKKFYKNIDFLSDQEYVDLIASADLVIVPSLNEGFSLPIFETFSFGSPLLFHKPSPAADILVGKVGVYAADLSRVNDVLYLVKDALDQQRGSLLENRKFLESIGATWAGIAQNYINKYNSVLGEDK